MENGRRYKIERKRKKGREREKEARAESPQDSPPWRIIAGGCGCCSIFELAPVRLWPLVYAAVRLSTTKRGKKRGNVGRREREGGGRDGRERHTCATTGQGYRSARPVGDARDVRPTRPDMLCTCANFKGICFNPVDEYSRK